MPWKQRLSSCQLLRDSTDIEAFAGKELHRSIIIQVQFQYLTMAPFLSRETAYNHYNIFTTRIFYQILCESPEICHVAMGAREAAASK